MTTFREIRIIGIYKAKDCFLVNGLKLNTNKIQLLHFRSNCLRNKIALPSSKIIIASTDSSKLLGVVIDEKLK